MFGAFLAAMRERFPESRYMECLDETIYADLTYCHCWTEIVIQAYWGVFRDESLRLDLNDCLRRFLSLHMARELTRTWRRVAGAFRRLANGTRMLHNSGTPVRVLPTSPGFLIPYPHIGRISRFARNATRRNEEDLDLALIGGLQD